MVGTSRDLFVLVQRFLGTEFSNLYHQNNNVKDINNYVTFFETYKANFVHIN